MPTTAAKRRAYYHAHKAQEAASHRRWRLKAGDKARERCRNWHKRNPQASWRNRLRFEHGLSLERWTAMLVEQAGRCAICLDPMRLPQVDHCHERGTIRGLLCRPCNVAIGIFRHEPALLVSAAQYLAEYHEAKAGAR